MKEDKKLQNLLKKLRAAWETVRVSRKFLVSGCIILALILIAVLAPLISPYHYDVQDYSHIRAKPSAQYWLGTDLLGRDLLSRMIYGTRISVSVGVIVIVLEALVGVLLGLLSGYYGGKIDQIVQRAADVTFAFPPLLFAILIVSALGPSLLNILIALTIVGWPEMTRLVRAQVLSLREKEFVEAARASGARKFRIILRYILPNTINSILVQSSMKIGRVIISEATLSFLGIGIQPPMPSWGSMINQSYEYMRTEPQLVLIPGMGLAVIVLAFNFAGEGLRDALDPQTSRFLKGKKIKKAADRKESRKIDAPCD
jgi:peptide/nickel transport system permease protein